MLRKCLTPPQGSHAAVLQREILRQADVLGPPQGHGQPRQQSGCSDFILVHGSQKSVICHTVLTSWILLPGIPVLVASLISSSLATISLATESQLQHPSLQHPWLHPWLPSALTDAHGNQLDPQAHIYCPFSQT